MWYQKSRPAWLDATLRRGFAGYYAWAGLLNRLLPPVRWDGLSVAVEPRVYRPLYREHELAVPCGPGQRVLEVGCGTGLVSLAAARAGADVTAVDVSPIALANLKHNAKENGIEGIRVVESDLFAKVEGRFDVVLTHPPYIELAMDLNDRRWGTEGAFVERFFAQLPPFLAPRGRVEVIFPWSQRERLDAAAAAAGLSRIHARRVRGLGWRNRLLRLLFLNVAFDVTFFSYAQRALEDVPRGA